MNYEAQSRGDDPSTFVRRTAGAPPDTSPPADASSTRGASATSEAVVTETAARSGAMLLDSSSIYTPAHTPSCGLSEPALAPAADDTRTTTTAPSSGYGRSSTTAKPAKPPSSARGGTVDTVAAAATATTTTTTTTTIRAAAATTTAATTVTATATAIPPTTTAVPPPPPRGTPTDSDGRSSGVYNVCPTCKGRTINGLAVVQSGGIKRKRKANSNKPVNRPTTKASTVADRGKPRARLTLGQKLEVLDLLSEKKMTKLEIAAVYGCSDRTVSSCSANRATLEAEAASTGRTLKSKGRRPAGFPEVDRRVLALIEAFRKNQIPVGRTTITAFAHAIKTSLLAAPGTIEDKKKLEKFGASDKWVKNFVSRSGLVSKPLPLKGCGVVDPERLQENVKEVQEEFKQYDLGNILTFDERGLLPKRSYLSSSEARSMELADDNRGESLGTQRRRT